MTTTQMQLARRTYNRQTAYELIAAFGDRKILAGYSCSKSRGTILRMLAKNGAAWVALTGDEGITWGAKTADGGKMGDWTIRFSGRTEHDAICEGELPYITEID